MSAHTGGASVLADAFQKAINAHDVAKIGELCAENVTYWEANFSHFLRCSSVGTYTHTVRWRAVAVFPPCRGITQGCGGRAY